jgi:hypothetical protein
MPNFICFLIYLLPGISWAQSTTTLTSPTACVVSGQDITFTACSGMYSTIESCSSINSVSGYPPFVNCLCQQGLFNDIYEFRFPIFM